MADFVHSIAAPDQAIAADGEFNLDLPVNPLSCIYLNLAPLNNTATIANYGALVRLLSALDNVRVDWRGASVINCSGLDLVAFLMLATNIDVRATNQAETDNERRSVVVPVPLGRRIWDPAECFPSVKRGELTLTLTLDIADTGYDGLRISVETLELLDAEPTHFQRLTTLNQTFAATGDNDVDLPIGNMLRGVLAFGTTGWTGATPAPTINSLRLLVDNVERGYASTDWEVSRAISSAVGRKLSGYLDHFHGVNAAGSGQEDTQSQQNDDTLLENYTYLDYDPDGTDRYALTTKGLSRVHLRINAEAADAARFIPVEKVAVNDFLRR